MDARDAQDLESDPRFPSGPWTGFFLQKLIPCRHLMELHLTFRQGTVTGEGRDWVGEFLVRGRYDVSDGRCHWTKRYVGKHDVFYRGFNEGKGIWGVWEIPTSAELGYQRGGFHIWPEGMADPVPSSDPFIHMYDQIAAQMGIDGSAPQKPAKPAPEIYRSMAEQIAAEAIKHLRIKVSGCFNSCGQHHVADIGFYGNSRNINGYTVPHFQVMLGGKWEDNAGAYALAMGSVPSKKIPDLVNRLTDRYVRERQGDESFQKYCGRLGKKALKEIIDEFTPVPPHNVDASFYSEDRKSVV